MYVQIEHTMQLSDTFKNRSSVTKIAQFRVLLPVMHYMGGNFTFKNS